MKSSQILLLVYVVLLLVFVGWENLLEALVLVLGTAILVRGAVYAVCKMAVFRSLRSAVASFFWRISTALGFSLIVVLSVGFIATIVMLLRGYVSPSESWIYVCLGFFAGAMGSVQSRVP